MSQKHMDRLFWDLSGKYFRKSASEIVAWDILWDIRRYKKYAHLNLTAKATLFERAVLRCDGEATWDYIMETEQDVDGSILHLLS